MADRRSVIITFKPKEERPDKRDKLEVLLEQTEARVEVLDARRLALGAAIPPAAEAVAYDVDEYEAPIVTASLTDDEIARLSDNDNVADVEEDGEIHALGGASAIDPTASLRRGEIVVEGQPSPLAETLPAGISQIKSPLAWGCSQGRGIMVGIVDRGIDG